MKIILPTLKKSELLQYFHQFVDEEFNVSEYKLYQNNFHINFEKLYRQIEWSEQLIGSLRMTKKYLNYESIS